MDKFGEPSFTESPVAPPAEVFCTSDATRDPDWAVTIVAISDACCTNAPTFSTTRSPGGTTNPWYACGVINPFGVRKETFTTAGGAAGSNRARVIWWPEVVEPPAKYHWADVWEAHGAVLQPALFDTD